MLTPAGLASNMLFVLALSLAMLFDGGFIRHEDHLSVHQSSSQAQMVIRLSYLHLICRNVTVLTCHGSSSKSTSGGAGGFFGVLFFH